MRILLSWLWLALSLLGFHPDTDMATFSLSLSPGKPLGSDASRVSADAGEARFACTASRSGRCHYLVLDGGCAAAPAAPSKAPAAACAPKVLQRFSLAVGEQRRVRGLPADFRHCLDYTAAPSPAQCLR